MHTDRRDALLYSAAFGPDPAAVRAECGGVLPGARTPYQSWLRGVAHGGAGHYARAAADLRAVCGNGDADCAPWISLAGSTWASLLRQMGGHGAAAVRDGRAFAAVAGLACCGPEGSREAREPASGGGAEGTCGAGDPRTHGCPRGPSGSTAWVRVARADALTGLAADRLGRGDWRSALRLLDRCAEDAAWADLPCGSDDAGPAHPLRSGGQEPDVGIAGGTRLLLRWQWVRAETAMTAGDPEAALAAARRAREIAGGFDSERHRIKTVLVGAAAEAVSGREHEARRLGELARERACASGLLPLRWAACMLLAGVTSGTDAGRRAERERDRLERRIRTRGGDAGIMARYL